MGGGGFITNRGLGRKVPKGGVPREGLFKVGGGGIKKFPFFKGSLSIRSTFATSDKYTVIDLGSVQHSVVASALTLLYSKYLSESGKLLD